MKKNLNKFIDILYDSSKKAKHSIKKSLIKIEDEIDSITSRTDLINTTYNPLIQEKQSMEKSLLSELNSLRETDNKLKSKIHHYKVQNEKLQSDIETLQEILFSK